MDKPPVNYFYQEPRRGTFAEIDAATDRTIDEVRACATDKRAVKTLLARAWLRADRPTGIFARARWLFELALHLWKKP